MSMLPPVQLNGGIAARVQPGAGEKVLWIHGYTMDSSVWAELWALLPGWHHIGIDLPGHGSSRRLERGEDLPTLATHLATLAIEQDVRHLIALSFGTIIALQMAVQQPSLFASIVLGAPALVGGPQDPDSETRYKDLARLYYQRGPGPHLRSLWMRSPPNIFKGAEAHPHLWKHLADVIDRHTWSELGDGRLYVLTSHRQTEPDLRKIQSATLILVGEHDMPVFKYSAQLISRWLPKCQQIDIPEAGHLCLLEVPQITHALIDGHLRAHSLHSRRQPHL